MFQKRQQHFSPNVSWIQLALNVCVPRSFPSVLYSSWCPSTTNTIPNNLPHQHIKMFGLGSSAPKKSGKCWVTEPEAYMEPIIGQTGFAAVAPTTVIDVFKTCVEKHGDKKALFLRRSVNVSSNVSPCFDLYTPFDMLYSFLYLCGRVWLLPSRRQHVLHQNRHHGTWYGHGKNTTMIAASLPRH